MGIKDLYNVIKEHCPEQLVTIHFSKLAGYRIAIDISVFLYKFIRSAGPERWVDPFLMLMCIIKQHHARAICIFDGPNFPIEKKIEQDARRSSSEKIKEKLKEVTRILHKVQEEYVPYDLSIDDVLRKDIGLLLNINPLQDSTNYKNPVEVCDLLQKSVDKYTKQTIPITSEFAEKAKTIMDILGIAYFQADGEAEGLCCDLAVYGEVDCVLTEDTDVLAYGTPIMLSKLDLSRGTVTFIKHENLVRGLGLDAMSFKDLCIMLGCDYNSRAKTYPKKKNGKPVGIGAKKAFELIQTYKSIERMEDVLVDSSVLKYPRCRELLSVKKPEKIKVPYPGKIDEMKLLEFLRENPVVIKFDYITQWWKKTDIVFH